MAVALGWFAITVQKFRFGCCGGQRFEILLSLDMLNRLRSLPIDYKEGICYHVW